MVFSSRERIETEALEAKLSREVRRSGAPGLSAAVVRRDGIRWAAGFGLADILAKTPATRETVYMWFSMTKMVTATAIMQLSEQHRLDLDEPVSKYIPNFPEPDDPARTVTIRHLLSHSSGLPNPIPIRWVHPVGKETVDQETFLSNLLVKHGRLRSNPGEKASYSNIGFAALGSVIAKASGRGYKEYVVERILRPLRMERTNFEYTPEMQRNRATGYLKSASAMALILPFMGVPRGVINGRIAGYRAFNPFYVDSASYAGLIGPVTDAARFLQAHLNDGLVDDTQLLTPESVNLMRRISAIGRKIDVGLGWYRKHSDSSEIEYLEHLGGGAGFFNDMRIFPRESLGIVVMGNGTSYDMERVIGLIRGANWP